MSNDEQPGWHRHPNGGGWVEDTAHVAPTAYVGSDAQVCRTARVEHTRHVVTVGPIGSENRTVTAYRTTDGHELVAGCWTGTVDELADRIAHPKRAWPDSNEADRKRWRRDYEAVITLVRSRLDEWNGWGDQS